MTDLSKEEKRAILSGRIYPAITACVGNRYKIALSFFAYYSFILNSTAPVILKDPKTINLYASWLFTFFIAHNVVNYFLNAKEELKLEQDKIDICATLCASTMEVLFAAVALAMVWVTYYLFR